MNEAKLQEITVSGVKHSTAPQDYRLKFNLAGRIQAGHVIDGKWYAKSNSYQSPTHAEGKPQPGWFNRNVYIRPFNKAAFEALQEKIKGVEQHIGKYHSADSSGSNDRSSTANLEECQLPQNRDHEAIALYSLVRKLRADLQTLNDQVEEFKATTRFSHKHLALIHDTFEDLELPIRLVTVEGKFEDDEEVKIFSQLLNEDILHLRLVATNISSKGAIALFKMLQKNTKLISLNLEANNLDNAAMLAFASCLTKNTTLKALSVSNNKLITSTCVTALLSAFQQNKSFCQIKLNGTSLAVSDIQSLTAAVTKNAPKITVSPSQSAPNPIYVNSRWFQRKPSSTPSEKTSLVSGAQDGTEMVSMGEPAEDSYGL
jgi:hypothetical protein